MMSKENMINNAENVVISSGTNKFVAVKFLNDETVYFGVEKKCKVNELYSKICVHLGLADCAELFGLAIKQINYPTSLFGPFSNNSNYYSASQIEESIKQDDTQFEEEFIFLDPDAKLSKYTTKQWKNSKNGLDSMGNAYLQCFFRVQFYVDSYLFITDRIARHHYYLQLRENVVNYNLSNLTLERAFLLTSLALQAEKGNYNESNLKSSSILNSTLIDNNDNHFNELNKCYFDPFDYMPKWIVYQMGESYVCENMPTMHKEQHGIGRIDAEIMFIKEASEICPHNLHMYRLFKTNPSSFNKKLTSVNSHFNAFFHGHHFNSSINSNSSFSSTMTNQSSTVSNLNTSNHSSNSLLSNSNKEGKVWLAISATAVQLFEQDKQIFINKSANSSFLDLNTNDQLPDQTSTTVCYLRSKLSTFVWADIEKLFFDKKKFEIRSKGYPTRTFTYYTFSDEMAKNLLSLCKMSHRFSLFIQPKLKEIKKRESELSRRKYRESYIYSLKSDSKNEKDKDQLIKIENLLEYDQEPNNHLNLKTQDDDDASLSASRNTLVGKDSLSLSQNKDYHLRPLSDLMKPIMDKLDVFDKQISNKLQFSNLKFNQSKEQNDLIDLMLSIDVSTNKLISQPMKKTCETKDQINFMKCVNESQNYNPFLEKSSDNFNQTTNSMFDQSKSQLENLDEFVIEHKENCDLNSYSNSNLKVQPSNQIEKQTIEPPKKIKPTENSLKIKLNSNNPFDGLGDDMFKPNKQTFSLESLTCSGLSEPSSSSGISEQEFSTTSENNDRKSNELCSPSSSNDPHLIHLNHQNNESPNSMQSRCSSNTSYSSDSALGKCSIKKPITQSPSKLPIPSKKIATNYKNYKRLDAVQQLKKYAFSVNDLHKKENYYSTINNNHLFEDDEDEIDSKIKTLTNERPKPRPRKSKFELKHKNKLNAVQYKSLPNVNNFNNDCNNRFGRLDLSSDDQKENDRFNLLNRSDKSTSSEQSVSTIKSNNKTNSSTKLNDVTDHQLNDSFGDNNLRMNCSNPMNWTKSIPDNKQNLDSLKNRIYENLPFQNTINMNRTPTTSTFLPSSNLITTTPNRITTKIGISSLNRCNKMNHNSAQKNNANLRLNLFMNTSLDRQNLRTCSYQLLNNQTHSMINEPNPTTPFKTTRASSDPGVITYSSTNLMKMDSKDSIVFHHNNTPSSSLNLPINLSNQTSQLINTSNNMNYDFNNYQTNSPKSLNDSMLNRSLNNLATNEKYEKINSTENKTNYDQTLINQINNQRNQLIKNQNYPLRLAESEMNLISSNTDKKVYSIPPPINFCDYPNYQKKATSEQQLNVIQPPKFLENRSNQSNQLKINLETIKQKSQDLDLPLITQLFNDKSLNMMRNMSNQTQQRQQKPKQYSSNSNQSTSSTKRTSFQQTNLDDSLILDRSTESNDLNIKYDKNYNNLDSNNLNNLNKKTYKSRSDFIDQIWPDHLLN